MTQNAAFNGHIFFPNAVSLLDELEIVQRTACKKLPLSVAAFLLIEISQAKAFALPVKKMYLNKMSPLSYDPADGKETLAACARAHAQRVARAAEKHFSRRERVNSSARAAERSFPPYILSDSLCVRKRTDIEPTGLDIRLALGVHRHRRNRFSDPHESSRVVTLF